MGQKRKMRKAGKSDPPQETLPSRTGTPQASRLFLEDLLCALWVGAAAARSNRLQTAVPQAQKLQC